ncbi:MAG: metalloregulator ArsR/SmtB family transcription factor [Alphaproteobacteria bacterium]|nr:metalloregulator ArsR/SmtB family transcription factor [Alphaproteobacteria bacterium]MBV9061570.1 metalloregulator ArsR/SmtB family transcription factor [Alphaproteobacteria bacterium]
MFISAVETLITLLQGVADPTRLRLLFLLSEAELTVSELTMILGQSQPRVSRHLKLLCEAGLLQRFKEGSWVFHRLHDAGLSSAFARSIVDLPLQDRTVFDADRARLAQVRAARAAAAAEFFRTNAPEWERIRSLHAPDKDVESAVLRVLGPGRVGSFLDAGTGTGRMLELLAQHVGRGIGIDNSAEMLAIARDRLEQARAHHCQVRLADIYRLPFRSGTAESGFDAVLFHQVLHYLHDPQAAVAEAARVLKPGGRLVIADFAPHDLEFLRTELSHRRLGFADREVESWFAAAGLKPEAGEAIAPSATDGKLTVKIWAARAAEARSKAAA